MRDNMTKEQIAELVRQGKGPRWILCDLLLGGLNQFIADRTREGYSVRDIADFIELETGLPISYGSVQLWRTEALEGSELGQCDKCRKTYDVGSRYGRCGDCGNCALHCDHDTD